MLYKHKIYFMQRKEEKDVLYFPHHPAILHFCVLGKRNPVLSQILPCPTPGFENVMETQEDCDCFYAFATVDLAF